MHGGGPVAHHKGTTQCGARQLHLIEPTWHHHTQRLGGGGQIAGVDQVGVVFDQLGRVQSIHIDVAGASVDRTAEGDVAGFGAELVATAGAKVVGTGDRHRRRCGLGGGVDGEFAQRGQGLRHACGRHVTHKVAASARAQSADRQQHKTGVDVGLGDGHAAQQRGGGGAVGVVDLGQPSHLGLTAQAHTNDRAVAVDDFVVGIHTGVGLCLCALLEQSNVVELAAAATPGGQTNADRLAHHLRVIGGVEHQHRPVAERARADVGKGVDRLRSQHRARRRHQAVDRFVGAGGVRGAVCRTVTDADAQVVDGVGLEHLWQLLVHMSARAQHQIVGASKRHIAWQALFRGGVGWHTVAHDPFRPDDVGPLTAGQICGLCLKRRVAHRDGDHGRDGHAGVGAGGDAANGDAL